MERQNLMEFDTKKKMTVLPPDPIFRFKSLGHIHCLCFVQDFPILEEVVTSNGNNENLPNQNISKEETNTLLQFQTNANQQSQKIEILMAAGEEGIIYFFNLEKNRLIYKQQMGTSIQSLHNYKSLVITQEKAGVISIYDKTPSSSKYEKVSSIECASGFCRSVKLLNSQLLIPQESETSTIQIYDLTSQSPLENLKIQFNSKQKKINELGQLMCMESPILQNQQHIFFGYETGYVSLWNLETKEEISSFQFSEQLISITFDPVTLRGVIGGASNNLEVFSLDRQNFSIKLQCLIALKNPGCIKVTIRPDKKILVCGGFDGRAKIYSWKTLRLLAVLAENHETLTDIQFSEVKKQNGGRLMAISGADGIVSLWSLYN